MILASGARGPKLNSWSSHLCPLPQGRPHIRVGHGAAPGIEPGASHNLSENHATRPSSQVLSWRQMLRESHQQRRGRNVHLARGPSVRGPAAPGSAGRGARRTACDAHGTRRARRATRTARDARGARRARRATRDAQDSRDGRRARRTTCDARRVRRATRATASCTNSGSGHPLLVQIMGPGTR